MVPPVVAVDIVTVTVPTYVPDAGVITGVAVSSLKTALATALSRAPPLNAAALTVVVVVTVSAAVYSVEDIVGSLPSVVYLMVAPEVLVARVTLTLPLKLAPLGVILGVSACIVNTEAAVSSLLICPDFVAYATIVEVVVTIKGALYDDALPPLTVYIILPPSACVMVTETVLR